jgi:hypothetical protein
MDNNKNGISNIAQGYTALRNNVSGSHNIAQGQESMYYNTSGCSNIAQGYLSLTNNTIGNNNIAQGFRALNGNTIGSNNIAIGECTGYQNVTGSSNVFIGTFAGSGNTKSNRLYIGNSKSSSLIYGEFDNKLVKIDGGMCISCLPAKTNETCLVYTDSVGKLSYGAISGDDIVTLLETKVLRSTVVNLSIITGHTHWNASQGSLYRLTLTGDTIFDNPTGIVTGATYQIEINQDVAGSHLLTWDSYYKFPSGSGSVISSGSTTIDLVSVYVKSSTQLLTIINKNFI